MTDYSDYRLCSGDWLLWLPTLKWWLTTLTTDFVVVTDYSDYRLCSGDWLLWLPALQWGLTTLTTHLSFDHDHRRLALWCACAHERACGRKCAVVRLCSCAVVRLCGCACECVCVCVRESVRACTYVCACACVCMCVPCELASSTTLYDHSIAPLYRYQHMRRALNSARCQSFIHKSDMGRTLPTPTEQTSWAFLGHTCCLKLSSFSQASRPPPLRYYRTKK